MRFGNRVSAGKRHSERPAAGNHVSLSGLSRYMEATQPTEKQFRSKPFHSAREALTAPFTSSGAESTPDATETSLAFADGLVRGVSDPVNIACIRQIIEIARTWTAIENCTARRRHRAWRTSLRQRSNCAWPPSCKSFRLARNPGRVAQPTFCDPTQHQTASVHTTQLSNTLFETWTE